LPKFYKTVLLFVYSHRAAAHQYRLIVLPEGPKPPYLSPLRDETTTQAELDNLN
jgi:hypothetical protein